MTAPTEPGRPQPDPATAEAVTGDPGTRESAPAGRKARSRMVALFLLGVVLFNPPLLDAFDVPHTVSGVPGIYLYVFGVWAAVVLGIGLGLERRR